MIGSVSVSFVSWFNKSSISELTTNDVHTLWRLVSSIERQLHWQNQNETKRDETKRNYINSINQEHRRDDRLTCLPERRLRPQQMIAAQRSILGFPPTVVCHVCVRLNDYARTPTPHLPLSWFVSHRDIFQKTNMTHSSSLWLPDGKIFEFGYTLVRPSESQPNKNWKKKKKAETIITLNLAQIQRNLRRRFMMRWLRAKKNPPLLKQRTTLTLQNGKHAKLSLPFQNLSLQFSLPMNNFDQKAVNTRRS